MIKILQAVSVGGEVHVKGDFVKLPKQIEEKYIKSGIAEAADEKQKPEPKAAPKKATKKKARRK